MSGPGGAGAVARMAPPRVVLFVAVTALVAGAWYALYAAPLADALVTGFDAGALVFIAALLPLRRDHTAAEMRRHAARNDANRGWVLAITALVSLTLLAAIAAELPAARQGDGLALAKLIVTLGLAWCFTNLVFMLHYAHMHYSPDPASGRDAKGFEFPGTAEPDYRDFLYFAFTAGMSFAASDVDVTRGAVRQIVVAHSLLSFVFNIGVLAFSINVLAGGAL